jgi:alkane 1-monooxygenase
MDARALERRHRLDLETPMRILGPLAYALFIPILRSLNPLAPLALTPVLIAVLLAAALAASPGERLAESASSATRGQAAWLTIAAQLLLIGWGVVEAATDPRTDIAVLAFAIGLGSGIFGLLAAHQMIHSPRRAENALGLAMLTGITYRHFRIAHLYGHHRWAATPMDPATARMGESAYAFLVRTIAGQFAQAWRFERARLASRPAAPWSNRVHRDLVVYAALYSALYLGFGWRGVLFLAGQSLVAVLVLEMFNYVAHYGMSRAALADGSFEPLADIHSWNSEGTVSNWLLFEMGHHSDHHRRSAGPRPSGPIRNLPQLPGGYVGAILVALVPPLWRRTMDPRVARWIDGAPASARRGIPRSDAKSSMEAFG